MNEIQCDVTSSTKVFIRANTSEVDLNEPLYAINWLSTKVEWLYHVYNVFASISVRKIGGIAFFKGKITETILDQSNAGREILLIVRYPGGQNFKALLENTYFKIVSILRIIAVKDFTFGFTHKRILSKTSRVKDNLSYVVHHFKSNSVDDRLFSKFQELLGDKVKIKYYGGMVAQLYGQKNSESAQQIPNLMDGLVLYESESQAEISKIINSPEYTAVIDELESSYIGYLKRTL